MSQYLCKRTDKCFTIDGDIRKPVWEEAAAAALVDTVTGMPPKQHTQCKLMYDDQYLYAAFYCEDHTIRATMKNFNDPIFEEEVVEIFLDDNSDLKTYIELEVSPLNTVLHYCMHHTLQDKTIAFARIENTILSAVKHDPGKSWSVEMAIPFTEFLTAPHIPPRPGDKWLFNLYRIDRFENPAEDEYTAWQATGKVNFHMPERFGTLEFVD